MDAPPRIPIAFRPRHVPLAPIAVAACGPLARALAVRLASRSDDALAKLSGVAGASLLVVIGAVDDLPWIDGVTYLGKDPAAPSLLLPTAIEPDAPLPLFERAILAKARGHAPPIAVLVDPREPERAPLLASVGVARPLRRREVEAFVESSA